MPIHRQSHSAHHIAWVIHRLGEVRTVLQLGMQDCPGRSAAKRLIIGTRSNEGQLPSPHWKTVAPKTYGSCISAASYALRMSRYCCWLILPR